MEGKQDLKRKRSLTVFKPFPIDFSTSKMVWYMNNRLIARFFVSDSFSSVGLDGPEWRRNQNGGEIAVGEC